ncbi:MAG: hypothetical protein AAGB48_01450 [Planctomycetota bacterium]
MAKMFYSLDEAAQALGKTPAEIRAMVESGELQEFRSGDDLVVKREQVDLLRGDDPSEGSIASEILGTGDTGVGEVGAEASAFDEDSLGMIGLSDSVMDDDAPIVDAGNEDSLVIGLEESSMAGSLNQEDLGQPELGDEMADEPSDTGVSASSGGSIGLTDSVTDTAAVVGDTTAGSSTSDPSPSGDSVGLSGSGLGSGIGLAPLTDPADPGASGSGVISLANESGGDIPIELGSVDAKDQTGISIFDDSLEDDDASAATIVTTDATAPDMSTPDFDAGASGSGLLDLTREGDDTSLGVDLIGDAGGSAAGVDAGVAAGALFETPDAGETDLATAAPMAAFAEAYDGGGSGLVGGLALGVILAALFTGAIGILWMRGGTGAQLFELIGDVPWFAPAAAIAGLTLVVTLIAWALGRRG